MIVWLASYPRSGNILLRILLKQVFEVPSCSKHSRYEDWKTSPGSEEIRELVGERGWPKETWEKSYSILQQTDPHIFVKTHDPPEDDSRAIYLVRDGRSAIESYSRYLAELYPEARKTIEDCISGFVTFGSWGGHLDAWDPQHRPETLLLRFQDMVNQPDTQIERIADFLDRAPRGNWKNDFKKWHELNPTIFRRGKVKPAAGVFSEWETELFWRLHGDWMVQLGYPAPSSIANSDSPPRNRGAMVSAPEKVQEKIIMKLSDPRVSPAKKKAFLDTFFSQAKDGTG